MLKAKTNTGDIILGLSEENIKRLKEGQPIQFKGDIFGLPTNSVTILYGETETKIGQMLGVIPPDHGKEKQN